MEEPVEIVTQQELREEQLLRLLAVFVQRFGGEVIISKHEYDMLEDTDVFASHITPDSVRLRLYDRVYDDEYMSIDTL